MRGLAGFFFGCSCSEPEEMEMALLRLLSLEASMINFSLDFCAGDCACPRLWFAGLLGVGIFTASFNFSRSLGFPSLT
jgi:hypothetical protein